MIFTHKPFEQLSSVPSSIVIERRETNIVKLLCCRQLSLCPIYYLYPKACKHNSLNYVRSYYSIKVLLNLRVCRFCITEWFWTLIAPVLHKTFCLILFEWVMFRFLFSGTDNRIPHLLPLHSVVWDFPAPDTRETINLSENRRKSITSKMVSSVKFLNIRTPEICCNYP